MSNGPMTHDHNGEFPMESLTWLYQVLKSGGKDFTLRDAVHHLHHLMAFIDAKLQPVVFGATEAAAEPQIPAKAMGAKALANKLAKEFPQLEDGAQPAAMGAEDPKAIDPATIMLILQAVMAVFEFFRKKKK